MLEVDIDVAFYGESKETLNKGVYLIGPVSSGATQAETSMRGGSVYLGGRQIVAFGDAEGCIVGAENGVDLLREPGSVAELEGDRGCPRSTQCGDFEKGRQTGSVGFEIRGKLEENEAQFTGLTHRLEDGDQVGDIVVAVGKTFNVGDPLWRFEAEAKKWVSGRKPVFEHLCGGQRTEGVVDLDRTKLRGVELEEFFRGCRGRVEGGLPCGVGPPRCSGEKARSGCA